MGPTKMTTRTYVIEILNNILDHKIIAIATRWQMTYGRNDSESNVIQTGIEQFRGMVTASQVCFLYGWIDQAVLEIVSQGNIEELSKEMFSYRPEQGGDSGIIAVLNNTALVLEMSFESENASIKQYNLAQQNLGGDAETSAPQD